MEARLVAEIPSGEEWQYEPKWDGFRCLAFRRGPSLQLQSKSGQPLERYFPEVVAELERLAATRFVLDGELVVAVGGALSFDDLLLRIHPAASRVRRLAAERPAQYILFDLLLDADGTDLTSRPLRERRQALEAFAERYTGGAAGLRLSPATRDFAVVTNWFEGSGGALDGVVAKRLACPYKSGERDGMVKVKRKRTADCVVGGARFADDGGVASLLLGLYDRAGSLNYVGFASAFAAHERAPLASRLLPLAGTSAFTGRSPGGPSRWKRDRNADWTPLRPELVLEVAFDQVTGGRFRHGARPLRWRPDKPPATCTTEQLEEPARTLWPF